MAPSLTLQCLACFLALTLIPATASKTSSCADDKEIADAQETCLLNVRAIKAAPASSPLKDKGASKGLQESRQESPQQLGSGFIEAAKATQFRMPREDALSKQVSIELAANVTARYVSALAAAGKNDLGPYLDQFCTAFKVVDPVGTAARRNPDQLKSMFGDRRAFLMPEDFVLRHHMTTIAQQHSYTAVSSSMEMMRNGVKYATVNRTDFLTISRLGCVKQVDAYWSLAGSSLLKIQPTDDHMRTEAAIRRYLTALDELGRNISPAYFHQFTKNFEVHDPFGTPPMTSVAELMKAIPDLAALLAPKGFTVTVKAVTVATDPRYGTAHLVLNIVEGPSIDIIDIFKIKHDLVKSLKAVWHIPGTTAPAPVPNTPPTPAPVPNLNTPPTPAPVPNLNTPPTPSPVPNLNTPPTPAPVPNLNTPPTPAPVPNLNTPPAPPPTPNDQWDDVEDKYDLN